MARFSFGAAAGAVVLTGFMLGSLDASAAENVTVNADGKRQTIVHVDTYNLATHSGTERLYRQIRYAAQRVCSPGSDRISLRTRAKVAACEQQAIANAVKQVGVPSLTVLHQTRIDRTARS